MAVTRGKIPEVLRPRLRLFMSVDIVNSTALKQPDNSDLVFDWLVIMQSFFGETVLAVQHQWARKKKTIPAKNHDKFLGDPPQFWKTVGDEVLFYKDLTDSRQLPPTIDCWKRALKTVRAYFYKQNQEVIGDESLALDVKSALWLAGFPRRNRAIISPSGLLNELCSGEYEQVFQDAHERAYQRDPAADGNASRIEFDFIGPGIDIGFRLCAFATVQKMIISMDVAYMLARERGDAERADNLEIYYDGRVPLRRVFNDKPYPIFWLDNSPAGSIWAKESRARHCIEDKDVRSLCNSFYKKPEHFRDFTHRPFIMDDPAGTFAQLPSGYLAWLDRAIERYEKWRRQTERTAEKQDAMREAGPARARSGVVPEIDLEKLPRDLTASMRPKVRPRKAAARTRTKSSD